MGVLFGGPLTPSTDQYKHLLSTYHIYSLPGGAWGSVSSLNIGVIISVDVILCFNFLFPYYFKEKGFPHLLEFPSLIGSGSLGSRGMSMFRGPWARLRVTLFRQEGQK